MNEPLPVTATTPPGGLDYFSLAPQISKVLHTREEIAARVKDMGRQITADYAPVGRDLVVFGQDKRGKRKGSLLNKPRFLFPHGHTRSYEMGAYQHHVPACPEVLDLLPEPLQVAALQRVSGGKSAKARLPRLIHREEVSHLLRLVNPNDVGRTG